MEDTYMNQSGLSSLWSKIKAKITEVLNAKFVDGVLPIESGGTGGSTASEAIKALTDGLPPSTNGNFYINDFLIPAYIREHLENPTQYPERAYKANLTNLIYWINNRNTQLNLTDTNYTTYMARGIAILNSVPGSMVNGTCAFLTI